MPNNEEVKIKHTHPSKTHTHARACTHTKCKISYCHQAVMHTWQSQDACALSRHCEPCKQSSWSRTRNSYTHTAQNPTNCHQLIETTTPWYNKEKAIFSITSGGFAAVQHRWYVAIKYSNETQDKATGEISRAAETTKERHSTHTKPLTKL